LSSLARPCYSPPSARSSLPLLQEKRSISRPRAAVSPRADRASLRASSTPLPCVGVPIIRLELSHLPSPSRFDLLRPRGVAPTRRLSAAPPAESPAVHQTFCAPVRDVGNFPLLCLCSKGASHERTVRSRHPLRGPRRHAGRTGRGGGPGRD